MHFHMILGFASLTLVAVPGFITPAVANDLLLCAQAAGDESIAACSNLLKSQRLDARNMANVYYNRGHAYEHEGHLDDALADFSEALKIMPDHTKAHYSRGIVYQNKGDFDNAICDYQESIRVDPARAGPHTNLGTLFMLKGRLDEAFFEFRAAILLEPRNPLWHINLGNILNQQKQFSKAIAEFKEAVRLDPHAASPHLGIGVSLAAEGKINEAIEEYAEASRLGPNDAGPHYNTALLRAEQARSGPESEKSVRIHEACNEFQIAVRMAPTNTQITKTLELFNHSLGENGPCPPIELRHL